MTTFQQASLLADIEALQRHTCPNCKGERIELGGELTFGSPRDGEWQALCLGCGLAGPKAPSRLAAGAAWLRLRSFSDDQIEAEPAFTCGCGDHSEAGTAGALHGHRFGCCLACEEAEEEPGEIEDEADATMRLEEIIEEISDLNDEALALVAKFGSDLAERRASGYWHAHIAEALGKRDNRGITMQDSLDELDGEADCADCGEPKGSRPDRCAGCASEVDQ